MAKDCAPVVLTYGNGRTGKKTGDYRDARVELERMKLRFSSHAAFTPGFLYNEILAKSGVAGEKSADRAGKRLANFKFPSVITDSIHDSLDKLEPGGSRAVAVRFDPDWAGGSAGTGIGKTGVAAIMPGAPLKDLVPLVEEQFRLVLASGQSTSVAAFKARKGTDGNVGIQIMPIHGAQIIGENKHPCIWPVMSVSYLGKVLGKGQISAGHGFDGSNFTVADDCQMPKDGFYDMEASISRNWIYFSAPSKMVDLKEGNIISLHATAGDEQVWRGLRELNAILERQTRPAYYEIANASLACNDWVATQYSPLNIEQVSKPVVQQKYQTVLETGYVVGTQSVKTNGIYIVSREYDPDALRQHNQNNSGYLLCMDFINPRQFFSYVPLDQYSNAGAILFLWEDSTPLFTHLNGLTRELGIPVLCTGMLLKDFKKAVRMTSGFYYDTDDPAGLSAPFDDENIGKASLTVYVNEFAKEGIIARA